MSSKLQAYGPFKVLPMDMEDWIVDKGGGYVGRATKRHAHLLAASYAMYKELTAYRKRLSATHRTVKRAGLVETGNDTIKNRLKRIESLLAKARGETP